MGVFVCFHDCSCMKSCRAGGVELTIRWRMIDVCSYVWSDGAVTELRLLRLPRQDLQAHTHEMLASAPNVTGDVDEDGREQ